ncbi:Transposase [Burkholderia glumae BGR1]|nr:Transposase [Burkholderia glumae BGR1]
MDTDRTIAATCEASSEERSWSPARVRPCGSQRHPVRVQNGNSLEPLADSSGLWLGRHMLAAIERLAKGWCMGPTARVATRQVACGRWSCPRNSGHGTHLGC